jgi:glutaminase
MDTRGVVKTLETTAEESQDAAEIIQAAADGDMPTLVRMNAQGANVFGCDYDSRTALHLATCNGHVDIVK